MKQKDTDPFEIPVFLQRTVAGDIARFRMRIANDGGQSIQDREYEITNNEKHEGIVD